MSDKQTMRYGVVWLGLSLIVSAEARANDLGEAVRWIQTHGGDGTVPDVEDAAEDASEHDALAFLNSRDVRRGAELSTYTCDDSPIDGEVTFRTNGNQKWALRKCRELMWHQKELPGYVTLGPPALSEDQIATWAEQASRRTDVPAKLIETIIMFQSGRRPGVVSEAGHYGLMQLKPEVLDGLGIEHGNLLEPRANIDAGARYLRALTFEYGGLKVALAAFVDGPGPVEAAGRKIPAQGRYVWFVREVMKLYYATLREFPDEIGAESVGWVWTWLD